MQSSQAGEIVVMPRHDAELDCVPQAASRYSAGRFATITPGDIAQDS
jgi:hypothetical protein